MFKKETGGHQRIQSQWLFCLSSRKSTCGECDDGGRAAMRCSCRGSNSASPEVDFPLASLKSLRLGQSPINPNPGSPAATDIVASPGLSLYLQHTRLLRAIRPRL
jgi:hypothetical protein